MTVTVANALILSSPYSPLQRPINPIDLLILASRFGLSPTPQDLDLAARLINQDGKAFAQILINAVQQATPIAKINAAFTNLATALTGNTTILETIQPNEALISAIDRVLQHNLAQPSLPTANTQAQTLVGGAGNDLLLGAGGNELLQGQAGNDQLKGNDDAGRDRFVSDDRTAPDTITDFEGGSGGDQLDLKAIYGEKLTLHPLIVTAATPNIANWNDSKESKTLILRHAAQPSSEADIEALFGPNPGQFAPLPPRAPSFWPQPLPTTAPSSGTSPGLPPARRTIPP